MQTAEHQGCAIASRGLFWLLTIAKLLHGVAYNVHVVRLVATEHVRICAQQLGHVVERLRRVSLMFA